MGSKLNTFTKRDSKLIFKSAHYYFQNRRSSAALQIVTVPYVSEEVCKKSHSDRLISPYMFCAGKMSGGEGPCNGDSGGPVVSNGVQYGIVSWSFGCALPNYPSVFAKVSAIRDWIKDISGV